jgi:hypothetical protein
MNSPMCAWCPAGNDNCNSVVLGSVWVLGTLVHCRHPPFAIPPVIHPPSSCSRGWRHVVCPWPHRRHPHPTPTIHPGRGCSQAWEQIPDSGSSIMHSGGPDAGRQQHCCHWSAHIHNPPYEQRLAGMGCAVSFGGLLVQGAYRRVSDTGG